jgi:osmotically-inducible protein OsmY
MEKTMRLFIILLSVALISGCAAPVVMFGGVAAAGATLSKEKTVGSSVDDSNIWTKVKAAFLQHHKEIPGIMTTISVEVSEGRVLLTGNALSSEDRLAILKLVWEQNGVREVINEIKIETGNYGFKTYSQDLWITTQVKAKLISNKEIRSLNYNIETIESVVYILGIARSETELALVIEEAEKVKNVIKVINYIRVKGTHEVSENKKEDFAQEPVIRSKPEEVTVEKPMTEKTKPASYDDDNEHVIEIGQDSE